MVSENNLVKNTYFEVFFKILLTLVKIGLPIPWSCKKLMIPKWELKSGHTCADMHSIDLINSLTSSLN